MEASMSQRVSLHEEEGAEDTFGKKLAKSVAKKALTVAATTLATTIAATAASGVGRHIGNRVTDFVTGSGKGQKNNPSQKGRSGRRESVDIEEKLKRQNAQLREALRVTGVALVMESNLNRLSESAQRQFVEGIEPHENFDSVVEFAEYIESEMKSFLKESGDTDGNMQIEESATPEPTQPQTGVNERQDPLGLFGSDEKNFIFERVVVDQ